MPESDTRNDDGLARSLTIPGTLKSQERVHQLSSEVIDLMCSQPTQSNQNVCNKWKELGPIDLDYLVKHLPINFESKAFG